MIDGRNFAVSTKQVASDFHPVVPFNVQKETIAALDLSPANKSFSEKNYESTAVLSDFINAERHKAKAKYLIGGYNETRNMYRRSDLFDKNISENLINQEPRNIHLGIDIWGDADTVIHAPLGGMIHSYAYNNNFGDYGATIILQHQVDTFNFYTLYGHLALKDLGAVRKGQFITRGEKFAHFGSPAENGNWPPHLHFQVVIDMGNWDGDYPGVCKKSEAEKYLTNCPDPDVLLNLRHYIKH